MNMQNNTQNILDERSFQEEFYQQLKTAGFNQEIIVDLSTDGHSEYILFEHKQNLVSYGINKTLGQTIVYLARMNARGIPVPGTIVLVDQNAKNAYLYSSEPFGEFINKPSQYAGRSASVNPANVDAFHLNPEIISFANGYEDLARTLRSKTRCFKVDISIENVVPWSEFYYRKTKGIERLCKKFVFFNVLRNPTGVMSAYINAWTGREDEFQEVMDCLNDPTTQKKLGAFYTPEAYAKKAAELLRKQIADWKAKYPEDDYLIIDRCAGTGNLEAVLTDEELSHCIINTYEVKEWVALKYRIGSLVREIIPPIPASGLPDHEGNLLTGSDALSKEFDVKFRESLKNNRQTEHCGIFFFENPPYGENGVVHGHEELEGSADGGNFKNSYQFNRMRKEVFGTARNDMANVFIWSAFKYMENVEDGYVVFGPIKYWKNQNIIDKKFEGGFLADRAEFHASCSAISVMSWKNEDASNDCVNLDAYIIDNNEAVYVTNIDVKKIHNVISDKMYDLRKFENDTETGIMCGFNGKEDSKEHIVCVNPIDNDNILGYMIAAGATTGNPGLTGGLLVQTMYNGHGFYLRKDNFLEKLPAFAAAVYCAEDKTWWYRDVLGKSADGYDRYITDVRSGKLNNWLIKVMLWTCWTKHNHMYSQVGSNGHEYINELTLNQNSFADETLSLAVAGGYTFSSRENKLIHLWNRILDQTKSAQHALEYNPSFKYNLFQIDKDMNGTHKNIDGETVYNDGDLNNMIVEFKKEVNKYYLEEIAPNLFKYEFLK